MLHRKHIKIGEWIEKYAKDKNHVKIVKYK